MQEGAPTPPPTPEVSVAPVTPEPVKAPAPAVEKHGFMSKLKGLLGNNKPLTSETTAGYNAKGNYEVATMGQKLDALSEKLNPSKAAELAPAQTPAEATSSASSEIPANGPIANNEARKADMAQLAAEAKVADDAALKATREGLTTMSDTTVDDKFKEMLQPGGALHDITKPDIPTDEGHSKVGKVVKGVVGTGLAGVGVLTGAGVSGAAEAPQAEPTAIVSESGAAVTNLDIANPSVTVDAEGKIELGTTGTFSSDTPSGEFKPQSELEVQKADGGSEADLSGIPIRPDGATAAVVPTAESATANPDGSTTKTVTTGETAQESSATVAGETSSIEDAKIAPEAKGVMKQALEAMKTNPDLRDNIVVVTDLDGSNGMFTKDGRQVLVNPDGTVTISAEAVQKAGFADAVTASMTESTSWKTKTESTTTFPNGAGGIETKTPDAYQGGIFEVKTPDGETLRACGVENASLIAESATYTVYDAKGEIKGTYGSLAEAPREVFSAGGKIETSLIAKSGCEKIAESSLLAIHAKGEAPGFDPSKQQDLVTSGGVAKTETIDGKTAYVSSVTIPEKAMLGPDGKPLCSLNFQVDHVIGSAIAKLGYDADGNGTPDWYSFEQAYQDVRLVSAGEGAVDLYCTPRNIEPKTDVSEDKGGETRSTLLVIRIAPPVTPEEPPKPILPVTGRESEDIAKAGLALGAAGGLALGGAELLKRRGKGSETPISASEAGAEPEPKSDIRDLLRADILNLQSEKPKIEVTTEKTPVSDGRVTRTESVNRVNVEDKISTPEVRTAFEDALARVGRDLANETGSASENELAKHKVEDNVVDLDAKRAEKVQEPEAETTELDAQIAALEDEVALIESKISGMRGVLKGIREARLQAKKAGVETQLTAKQSARDAVPLTELPPLPAAPEQKAA